MKAKDQAFKDFGIKSAIIMCFLRDESIDSALNTFQQSLPHIHQLIGVGLNSDEKNNPPVKFFDVFNKARNYGLYITAHCDVNQINSIGHINQALHVINVDRIDHGYGSSSD